MRNAIDYQEFGLEPDMKRIKHNFPGTGMNRLSAQCGRTFQRARAGESIVIGENE